MIFYTLVILTVVTVAVAFKRFDNEWVNVLLALLVACVKATFVGRLLHAPEVRGKADLPRSSACRSLLGVILVLALIPDIGHGFTHRLLRPPFTPMVEISPRGEPRDD